MNRKTLLIAAGICGLATAGQAATMANLVAWYKFDEGAAATVAANEVAGSTTGAVGASVTTGVAGISGNAYQFNNLATQAGVVDMGNANFFSSITTSGQLTISAWVNTTDTTGNRNTAVFAGNASSTNVYADLGVSGAAVGHEGEATARNRPVGASAGQQTGVFSDTPPTVVNDGTWHNLVMTINLSTTTLNLYVDGVLTGTQDFSGGAVAFPTFNNFEVGRLGRSSPVDPFDGLIDDVQVYDAALTANEVLFLFNNPGVAVPEPSAVAMAIPLGVLFLAWRRRAARKTC